MKVAHSSEYRLGKIPQGVVMVDEGERAYVDVPAGRIWLQPGDTIQYDADWNPIDVLGVSRLRAAYTVMQRYGHG